MFRRPIHSLTVVCGVVTAMLAMPASSRAGRILDCLFGTAPPSQTTYAPPFAPADVAPAYAPVAAPACGSCAPCISYVPQTCQYMPTVVYRALYQPASYAVTTYRPFLGTYQTRLVPYTTYRPVYTPVVSYGYVGYSPYAGCSPYVGCSSGGGCSSCGSGGSGAVMYGAPASGCASCGVPAASPPVSSSPAPEATPPTTPKTFQNEAEKPPAGPELKPVPQGDVQPNSLPAPALPDPNNRRVASAAPVRPAARVQPAAWNGPAGSADDDDGWRPARE